METRTQDGPVLEMDREDAGTGGSLQLLPAAEQDRSEPGAAPAPQATAMDGSVGMELQRVIVRYSREVGELFAALAAAQACEGYGDIVRSRTARVNSRKGAESSYTYDYETLKDVITATQPHLAANGLSVMQFPFPGARSVTIRTMIAHKSGQWLYNDLSAAIVMPDPQAVGGAISYLRRYAQKAILNVAADDDDDAVGASGRAPRDDADQRREAPRAAPRKSQAQPPKPAAQQPEATQARRETTGSQPWIGKVADVRDRQGAFLVVLDTGYQCGTANAELAAALKGHRESGTVVELTCRPSGNPRHVPVLDQFAVATPRPDVSE